MASTPTRRRLNPQRVRRCTSQKVGFTTYAEALNVAEMMMQQGQVWPGCHIQPFQCQACGAWHVGNRVIVSIGLVDQ